MRENANRPTSTAGCVPACTPGASQPLPEKAWASCHVQRRQKKIGSPVVMKTLCPSQARSSEQKEISELWHGEELLNDVPLPADASHDGGL